MTLADYNQIHVDFCGGCYRMVEGLCGMAEELLRTRCMFSYSRCDSRYIQFANLCVGTQPADSSPQPQEVLLRTFL